MTKRRRRGYRQMSAGPPKPMERAALAQARRVRHSGQTESVAASAKAANAAAMRDKRHSMGAV